MPAASARSTARRCSAGCPFVIKPPTAPQPKPSADTIRPVLPRGRISTPRSLPGPLHQLRNRDAALLAMLAQASHDARPIVLRTVLAQLQLALQTIDLDGEADHVAHQRLDEVAPQQAPLIGEH